MFKLATHSGRLERWIGKERLEQVSLAMRGANPEARWYGKPIALAGVPGRVYVGADGDFRGRIVAGFEATVLDYVESFARRLYAAAKAQTTQVNSGFASMGDLISASKTPGKKRQYQIYKVGIGAVAGAAGSLWTVGNYPIAGAAASAAPGGRVTDSSTAGALPFTNPASGTQHFVAGYLSQTQISNTLLLYDRIFDVAKTMNSTSTEAVTGVPTRYQSTTGGDADSAENNFLIMECTTVLSAGAHNWTVCQYTNQAGTTAQTLPSVTGIASCAATRIDMPLNQWFAPLAAGDSGMQALTQMQCSAAVATGAINFVMGHPIAFMMCPLATSANTYDGVTSAFNFERIFDNACLALLQVNTAVGSATTYQGTLATVTN